VQLWRDKMRQSVTVSSALGNFVPNGLKKFSGTNRMILKPRRILPGA
jgi:hypothetical protein